MQNQRQMLESNYSEAPPAYESTQTTLQRLRQILINIAPIVSTITGAGMFTLPSYFFGAPIASETVGIALFQFGLVLFAEQIWRQVLSRARASSLDIQISVTSGRFCAALMAATTGFLTIVGLTQGFAGTVGPSAVTAIAYFLGGSLGVSAGIPSLVVGAAMLLGAPAAAFLAGSGVVTAVLVAVDAIPTALSWVGRMVGQGVRAMMRPFFGRDETVPVQQRSHKD